MRAERREIILEIIETEEKYGRDLQIIIDEFYKPMLVAGELLMRWDTPASVA
jgi:RhoGEF, Guanine nucleotide exchange factor for Rho/Rac/Cdc42-like GTPases